MSNPDTAKPATARDTRKPASKIEHLGGRLDNQDTSSLADGQGRLHLTRAQRRKMQKLADRVDRVTQADRLFFERFPNRMHRVRLASQAEIQQQELVSGAVFWMPPACRIFACVRNIAPGVRLRLMVRSIEGAETDVSERIAAAIFNASASPQTWKIEAQMRQAAEARA